MKAMDVFSSWRKPDTLVALMGVMLLNLICTACWKLYSVPQSYELHDHCTYKSKLRMIILFHVLLM